MSRTEINELGEFGLINMINSQFKNSRKSTILGIGDDAAVIAFDKKNNRMFVTGKNWGKLFEIELIKK